MYLESSGVPRALHSKTTYWEGEGQAGGEGQAEGEGQVEGEGQAERVIHIFLGCSPNIELYKIH